MDWQRVNKCLSVSFDGNTYTVVNDERRPKVWCDISEAIVSLDLEVEVEDQSFDYEYGSIHGVHHEVIEIYAYDVRAGTVEVTSSRNVTKKGRPEDG